MSKPIKKDKWSQLDAIGLLNGLSTWDENFKNLKFVKRPIDGPLELRDRIIRNNLNTPGVTHQGIINGLSNEFAIDPYSVETKTIFELSNYPVPTGVDLAQDIFVSYLYNDTWYELTPQVWSDSYSSARSERYGFIVWQQDKYINIPGIKNYTYSNLIEILEDLPNNTKLKITYSLYSVDEENIKTLVQFTDMDNLADSSADNFTYKKPETPDLANQIVVYNLGGIPSSVVDNYYSPTTGIGRDFLYVIKNHIDSKFKHTWNRIQDSTCIWDVEKDYGSGDIPNFYDAAVPPFFDYSNGTEFSIYYDGGIDSFSESLYFKEVVQEEVDGVDHWYLRVFPGKFYMYGIPHYLFENPQNTTLELSTGQCTMPNGLERYHYTIMVQSGYYESIYNTPDPFISGYIFEDYSYPVGQDGNTQLGYKYRRRPYLTSLMGYQTILSSDQYSIDFTNGIIYSSGINNATLIWDAIDTPSGVKIDYDINPLNEQNLSLEKYFIYLSPKSLT